jgi:hypothetical protein
MTRDISSQGIITYGGNNDGLVLKSDFENVTKNPDGTLNFYDVGGHLVQQYWDNSGAGTEIWIEGLDANRLPGGSTPYSGTRCLGLATTTSTAYRSQLDVYLMRCKDANNNPMITDEWYYNGWFFLPPNWSLNSTGWRWYEIGDPYQDIVGNSGMYYPQMAVHILQPNHSVQVYDIELTERNPEGLTQISVYHNFPLPLGRWFKVEWYVHCDTSSTLDGSGNLVPNNDSIIRVWMDGIKVIDSHGTDFSKPLIKSGMTGYLGVSTPTENYITVSKVYYGESPEPQPKQIWVDDIELWNRMPP